MSIESCLTFFLWTFIFQFTENLVSALDVKGTSQTSIFGINVHSQRQYVETPTFQLVLLIFSSSSWHFMDGLGTGVLKMLCLAKHKLVIVRTMMVFSLKSFKSVRSAAQWEVKMSYNIFYRMHIQIFTGVNTNFRINFPYIPTFPVYCFGNEHHNKNVHLNENVKYHSCIYFSPCMSTQDSVDYFIPQMTSVK